MIVTAITRKLSLLHLLLFTSFAAMAQQNSFDLSKDRIKLQVSVTGNGTPQYAVWFNGKEVIKNSGLGFSLENDSLFYEGFSVLGSNRSSVDKTWAPVWGEVKTIRNNYEQLTLHLIHRSGKLLDIVFRAFADGIGFRYEFPFKKT